MSRQRLQKLTGAEQGMVSIIVTMIIMSVLTLIVLGFAQLARREQREALDKQLGTQAFYAAESGVNDAIRAIGNGSYANNKNKTNCGDDAPFTSTTSTLDADTQVGYTCLLIDQTPSVLSYGSVSAEKSTVVPLNPVDPANPTASLALNTLDISWSRADGQGSTYYGGGSSGVDLPTVSGWGSGSAAGILRLDLVPLRNGSFSRANLIDDTFTVFLYPEDAGGSTAPKAISYTSGASSQGSIQKISCGPVDPPYFANKCKVRITGLPTGIATNYNARLISLYSDSVVSISGTSGSGSALRQVAFVDAQYVIDSTGKAGDVLKRVRVRNPAHPTNYTYPVNAINSAEDICKLLEVYPTTAGPLGQPGGGTDGC